MDFYDFDFCAFDQHKDKFFRFKKLLDFGLVRSYPLDYYPKKWIKGSHMIFHVGLCMTQSEKMKYDSL